MQSSIQRGTTPSHAGKYFMRVEPKGTIPKEQIKNIETATLHEGTITGVAKA